MTPGQSIAHYRVTSKLGEGGMGAVYRATDTKLNREVAIKILPHSFAEDPGRLARFTREAQVLAALNHPNIAAIHGVEQNAIVMELVEGAELKGPLPLETALDYAAQIAGALEAAHEKGITHRDLKPANIKVTPQGAVKVLDFGLAKTTEAASAASATVNSPTLTIHASEAGVILGTAAYMAPEQARGQYVDKRADIWAFGVVLWEMLTGRQMFEGETVSDVLAGVLKNEPDLAQVPASIRPLLAACLEKDPRKRLRDIGDWRRTLAGDVPPSEPRRLPWLLAAFALAIALGFAIWGSRSRAAEVDRFPILLSADLGPGIVLGPRYPGHLFAISPDGTLLAISAAKPDSPAGMSLAISDLRTRNVRFLPGTDDASDPFFSPDGRWIAFVSEGKLRKIPVEGGSVIPICDLPGSRGGVWTDDDQLIVSSLSGPLIKVSAEGGKPVPFTRLGNGEKLHRQPSWMPGSDLVLFTSVTGGALQNPVIHAISRKTGQTKRLVSGAVYARQTAPSRVIFVKEGTFFTSGFDPGSMELRGNQVPVLGDIRASSSWGAAVSISARGTLVFAGGGAAARRGVYSVGRGGQPQAYALPDGSYRLPELSPDGRRIAIRRTELVGSGVWIADLERGTEFRLTGEEDGFVWTPDGSHIVYKPANELELWSIRADGGSRAEKVAAFPDFVVPASFSPDGKVLLMMVRPKDALGGFDLYTAPFSPGSPAPVGERRVFLEADHTAMRPVFSPDGKWVAYHSTEDGFSKVYVRPYPGPGPRVQVSRGWAQQPRWSRARPELLFQGGDRRVMVVPYTVRGGVFNPGEPAVWSDLRAMDSLGVNTFDVDPSGARVILPGVSASAGGAETHLLFLFNFFDEIARKAPLP